MENRQQAVQIPDSYRRRAAVDSLSVMRILIVCTANVCRSPMAAALLVRHLEARHLDAIVSSAGTRAGVVLSDPDAIATMARRGLDISGHRPRQVDRPIIDDDGADLIITMTREQLRSIAVMAPGSLRRAFTVRELARRTATAHHDRPMEDGSHIDGWVAAIGPDRRARDLVADDPADDLADPYGDPAAHVGTAEELDRSMSIVADGLSDWIS